VLPCLRADKHVPKVDNEISPNLYAAQIIGILMSVRTEILLCQYPQRKSASPRASASSGIIDSRIQCILVGSRHLHIETVLDVL
jgi:hypothetical protein